MDTDDQPSITDPEDAAWIAEQGKRLIDYLQTQRVEHGGASLEPRWFLSPYIAIWAVRSKINPQSVGWWAISGDVPTDYITCWNEASDADVLRTFSKAWMTVVEAMQQGRQPPNYQIGPPGREKEFAPLLLKRAQFLAEVADDLDADEAENQEE